MAGYIFKHEQTLTVNGTETTNRFTSPEFESEEERNDTGNAYWNQEQSIDWGRVDKAFQKLEIYTVSNGIEILVGTMIKGTTEVLRPD